MSTQDNGQLYKMRDIVAEVGEGITSISIRAICKKAGIKPILVNNGPGGSEYSISQVEKIRAIHLNRRQGYDWDTALELAENGRLPHKSVLMAFRTPPRALKSVSDSLLIHPKIDSVGSFYGPFDLVARASNIDTRSLEQLISLQLEIFSKNKIVCPPQDLSFIISEQYPANVGAQWAWDPNQETISALILMQPLERNVGAIINLLNDSGVWETNFSTGVLNHRVESLEGAWNLAINVEAESIRALTTLVSKELKAIALTGTRTATFVEAPNFTWLRNPSDYHQESGEKRKCPIQAIIFAKTRHDIHNSKDEAFLKINKEGRDYGIHSIAKLLTGSNYDLAIEVQADSQEHLAILVYDIIGQRTEEVSETLTHILLDMREEDSQQAHFLEEQEKRSAYFLLEAPNQDHAKLEKALKSVCGVKWARTCFGYHDCVGVLSFDKLEDLRRIVQKIREIEVNKIRTVVQRIEVFLNRDTFAMNI